MEETHTDLVPEQTQATAPETAQPESFEVIDYVRELFLNSEEQKKLERKKIRLMRVCVALISVVALVVVASAAILVPMLMNTVSQANQTLTTVQQIDIKAITTNIDELAVQANDTFKSVGEAVTVLDALDMESLNATIAELKTGVESFSQLDIETLNTAIENLNATVEPLARLFGKK
ncbi:MAG: hypothetical protein GX417_01930 [Clostridiales bacterium]|nr:hypothetical protein [Clostridiales bacterium]